MCQAPRCVVRRPIKFEVRRSKVEVRSYNPARFVPLTLSEEIPMARALAGCVVAFLVLTGSASAQWITIPLRRTPRTADGKPNMTAPAPRMPDGKPDLSGIWTRVEATRKGNE